MTTVPRDQLTCQHYEIQFHLAPLWPGVECNQPATSAFVVIDEDPDDMSEKYVTVFSCVQHAPEDYHEARNSGEEILFIFDLKNVRVLP